MGPRSDERGNSGIRADSIRAGSWLQWGRAPMSAEIPALLVKNLLAVGSFNGAALR